MFRPVLRPAEFIPKVMIRSGACEIYVGGNISTRTLKTVMKVLSCLGTAPVSKR